MSHAIFRTHFYKRSGGLSRMPRCPAALRFFLHLGFLGSSSPTPSLGLHFAGALLTITGYYPMHPSTPVAFAPSISGQAILTATRNICAPTAVFQNQWCLNNEIVSTLTHLTTGSPIGSINTLLAHYGSFSHPKESVSQRVPQILPPPTQPRPSERRSAQVHYALPSVHRGQSGEHICSTSLNLLVCFPQTDTDASRDVLLHHPGRETISWTGLPGKDSPSQSGMWRVEPGGGHVVTSSHMENKAAGAWVRGAPCCGLCLEAAEPVAQTRLLAVTVGLGDGISGGWSASPGKHLLCRIVLQSRYSSLERSACSEHSGVVLEQD